MKSTVYIETTIVSVLTSRESRDIVLAAQRLRTIEWWNESRPLFDLFTSTFVEREAAAGDPTAAQKRLEVLRQLPSLAVNHATLEFAEALILEMELPTKAKLDAAHIAVAALNGIEFLLTWNCKHLANAQLAPKIERVCGRFGVKSLAIVTPDQLGGLP